MHKAAARQEETSSWCHGVFNAIIEVLRSRMLFDEFQFLYYCLLTNLAVIGAMQEAQEAIKAVLNIPEVPWFQGAGKLLYLGYLII
jgi:hypothetical protein